ncbi:MAG TPA: hypothetical protein VFN72_04605 [Solirubrobacterales bacterium]|nr:hypothetical protein [Solirubrobacterales bacterium]
MPATPNSIREIANELASQVEAQFGKDAPVRATLVVSVELDLAGEGFLKRVLPPEMRDNELADFARALTGQPFE